MRKNSPVMQMALSMFIFGTIGIFRRWIPIPSEVLAVLRGLIGSVFLLVFIRIRGTKLSLPAIKRNAVLLIVSGALIGLNWMLLFEAYKYTSVAVATLCYYMEPVFLMLAAPFVLGEKLTPKKAACVAAALLGMVLISGVLKTGASVGFRGVLLGLGAAALYTTVVLMNKKLKDIPAYDQTIVQLAMAAVIMLPFIMTGGFEVAAVQPMTIVMLLVVGVVHTGIAYVLYFGAMNGLTGQTIALLSYIDPIVAVILSAVLLHEPIGLMEIAGAVLVLGSTIVSELGPRNE